MSENKDFQLGNKAKDLLVYTFKVTKPVSEKSVETKDVLGVMLKLRGMKPEEIKKYCDDVEKRLRKSVDRQGFPKSAMHSYVTLFRNAATGIVENIQLANDCHFDTEYEDRLERINDVLKGCNLMLQLIDISLELGYINLKRSKHWTNLVTDVKYMTLAWRKKDRARAAELRKSDEAVRSAELARVIAKVFLETGVLPGGGSGR